MATKQYRVVREAHEHGNFYTTFPEYAGYRIYLVEAPRDNSYSYGYRNHQFLVTREGFIPQESVYIDEDMELLPVREQSSIHLAGNKVHVYRPERQLAKDFEIVSFATDGEAVERFGGKEYDRRIYNIYNAKRVAQNGYPDVLVRIFTQALYAKGMYIPANEVTSLPPKSSTKPHYEHNTQSKAYTDRVWQAVKSSCR